MAKLIAGWGPEKSHFIGVYLDEFALHAPGLLDRRARSNTLAHCQIMRTCRFSTGGRGRTELGVCGWRAGRNGERLPLYLDSPGGDD